MTKEVSPEDLLDLGVRLFPVRATKIPAIKGWQRHATDHLPDLHALVLDVGNHYGGLGAVMGEGYVVLDIDSVTGQGALEDLAWEADQPLMVKDHLVGRTPRGGLHIWYKAPLNAANRNRTHLLDLPIDFRGAGGLVVTHSPGRTLEGHVTPEVPDWLMEVLLDSPNGDAGFSSHDALAEMKPMNDRRYMGLMEGIMTAPEGNRNAYLYWAACRTWTGWLCTSKAGRPAAEIVKHDLALAARRNGLDEHEILATIESAWKRALSLAQDNAVKVDK